MIFSCLRVVSAVLPAFFAVAAPDDGGGIVFTTGMFHGEEFDLPTGAECLGLFREGEGFAVRPVAIDVAVVHDGIVDGEDEKTGRDVSVPGEAQPLFLFRDVPGLQTGSVNGTTSLEGFQYPGETRFLAEGEGWLRLQALGRAEEWRSIVVLRDYALTLQRESPDGPVRQELVRQEELGSDGRPTLLWSGDLDGDGRTDLLMNLTDHYNVSDLTLYLSSKAHAGELVGVAARHVTTGC